MVADPVALAAEVPEIKAGYRIKDFLRLLQQSDCYNGIMLREDPHSKGSSRARQARDGLAWLSLIDKALSGYSRTSGRPSRHRAVLKSEIVMIKLSKF